MIGQKWFIGCTYDFCKQGEQTSFQKSERESPRDWSGGWSAVPCW